MTIPKLEIKDLHVKYWRGSEPAITACSLKLWPNQTTLLLGPSGCGKTTLGLCITGVVPRLVQAKVRGEIIKDGVDLRALDAGERARNIGMVFQDPESQFCTLYVRDEVAFPMENLRVAPAQMRNEIPIALRKVGLAGYDNRVVYRLSGGEKQRVALASILALDPEVLILDAPTANLDPVGTRETFQIVESLSGSKTILIVEQNVDGLMHFVDRVLLMNKGGQIIAGGPPQEVFSSVAKSTLDDMGVWYPQLAEVFYSLPTDFEPGSMEFDMDKAAGALSRYVQSHGSSYDVSTQAAGTSEPNIREVVPNNSSDKLAVETRNLDFTYPDGTRALRQADLRVPLGRFFAIVGQNGSGKTTLVQHLNGIRKPPRGSVFLMGSDIATLSVREITQDVGYVFQNPEHQFVARTVSEELSYSLLRLGISEDDINEKVDRMLELFGLSDLVDKSPYSLSAGEMRRLSVATMLVVGPEILILDEPTFGQDRKNSIAIMQLLEQLHRNGRTIIMVTHNMRLVSEYAESVSVMAGGSIVFSGTPRELFSQPSILAEASLEQPPVWQLASSLGITGGVLSVEELISSFSQLDQDLS